MFETEEDYYDSKTVSNYIRAMKQFIDYAINVQHTKDIIPPSPNLLCFFLSSRVKTSKSYGAWTAAWSGIIACLNALGFDVTYLRTNETLVKYRTKFARIYGKTADIRNAILLQHYVSYAKSLNVSLNTCWNMPLLKLFKVMIAQIIGFTGTRCMELFPYNKNLKFLQTRRDLTNDPFLIPNENYRIPRKGFQGVLGKDTIFHNGVKFANGECDYNLKHYTFDVYTYKNKKSKLDSKQVVIGYSDFEWCDPAQLLHVYQLRFSKQYFIQQERMQDKRNYSNNFFFRWPDGSPCTVENVKDILLELKIASKMPLDFKITAYSARIGLPTMMLERGLSETMVYDFGAWARPKSSSAMMGYSRMSLANKVRMVRLLCNKQTIFKDVLFSPADFHQ